LVNNRSDIAKEGKEDTEMTDYGLDQLARQIMLDAARLEYGSLPEEPHTFSPAFERKMKKLLRRGRHPVLYRTLRGAACLLLVLLLSGCAVLAVSPAAREVFAGWVREIHDNYFLYEFFGNKEREAVSEEDALYQPAYVPAGYRIEHRTVLTDGVVTIGYINDQANDIAVFTYFSDTSSAVLQVTGENEIICQQVQVNGLSADLYLDSEEGEANVIVWVDEKSGAAFRISGVLSGEELTRMAESVRAVPRNVIFRPSWLPEGYYETSAEESPVRGDKVPEGLDAGKSVLTYENGKGGCLTITYAQEFDVTDLRPNRCEADAVSVLVGENQAFLFPEQTEAHHLVWVDGESGVFFWISGPLTGAELVQIGESLEKREEPPSLEARSLTWVPAGYQELERVEMREQSFVQYQNDEGYVITLSYSRGTEAVHPHVVPSDGGELTLQPVRVDGLPGDLYLEEGEANVLVWAQDGLLFSIQGCCTAEELIAMAESVEVLPVEYRLTWVPEGYELYMQNETFSHLVSFVYKTPEGNMLSLTYQPDLEGAKMYLIPDEDGTEKQASVKGNPADLYLAEPGGSNSELVWQDPEAGAIFIIDASLPGEDILKMAESIEAVRPLPKVRQPNWLPMGYRYAGGLAGGSGLESQYENRNGDEIQFAFLGPHEAEKQKELRETVKGLESQSVLVNGQATELYSAADGVQYLVWNGQEAGELYWLAASLDTETLVQIAESVQLSWKP